MNRNAFDLFEAAFYVIILFRWFGFASHIGYRRLDGFAALEFAFCHTPIF